MLFSILSTVDKMKKDFFTGIFSPFTIACRKLYPKFTLFKVYRGQIHVILKESNLLVKEKKYEMSIYNIKK